MKAMIEQFKQTHRPGLVMVLGYMLGIMLGMWFGAFKWFFLAGAILLLLGRQWVMAIVCTAAFIMSLHQQLPAKPRGVIEGVIISPVEQGVWMHGSRATFLLATRGLKINVQYYGVKALQQGDVIKITGKVFRQQPLYQQFNDIHGVFWQVAVGRKDVCQVIKHGQGNVFKAFGQAVHDQCVATIKRFVTDDLVSTIVAMALGDRSQMPNGIKTLFINSGTAHILAISGMNMGVVSAMFFFAMKLIGLPRRWQLLLTLMLLWLYALACGLSASVVRACVMISIIILGWLFDEQGDALNSFGIAALLLLMIDPGNLLDIGFQLSFAAVAGILLSFERFKTGLNFLPAWLANSLALSLSASIATAPILYYHFKTFTPIGIIANIPIVPLADFIVLLSLLLALTGAWLPFIPSILATLLKSLYILLMWLALLFSQIPGGHW